MHLFVYPPLWKTTETNHCVNEDKGNQTNPVHFKMAYKSALVSALGKTAISVQRRICAPGADKFSKAVCSTLSFYIIKPHTHIHKHKVFEHYNS